MDCLVLLGSPAMQVILESLVSLVRLVSLDREETKELLALLVNICTLFYCGYCVLTVFFFSVLQRSSNGTQRNFTTV